MGNKSSAGKRRKPKRSHPWFMDKMGIMKVDCGTRDFLACRFHVLKAYNGNKVKVA